MTFDEKLARFIAKCEADTLVTHLRNYSSLVERAQKEGRRAYEEFGHDPKGPRFVRVWRDNGTQRFVHSFVERDTGKIFGANGWKKYNPVRCYGTLDTIDEWFWGGYYGEKIGGTDKDSLVPKEERT